MAGVVLVRRAHPVVGVLGFVAVAFAWWPAWGFHRQGPLSGFLAALFVFYAIGAHGTGRRDDVIALVAAVGFQLPDVVAATLGEESFKSDTVLTLGLLLAVWLGGR